MNQLKCCYVDCSDTFFSGLNTGIQRVVRNIISRIDGLEGYCGYRFIPVITVGSDIFKVSGSLSERYLSTRVTKRLLGDIYNILDFFAASKDDLVPDFTEELQTPRSVSGRTTTWLHWTIVSGCRKIVPFLLKLTMFLDTLFLRDKKVTLIKGDIIFFADSFWNASDLPVLQIARKKLASIILLVYDIIPITHPTLCTSIHSRKFNEFLPQYLKMVDGVISISRDSMNEIIKYSHKSGIHRNIAYDYFYLGADFTSDKQPDNSQNQLISDLGNETFFLMVGTIEPRKNHAYVLDAFERLWQEGSNIKLCIVGKIGWKCDAIMKRITTSTYLNKNLIVFYDLDDTDLRYLLKRTHAVIIASIVEGFGLPVVEAMHLQKTLLASDIPVFREIGGDYPLYFPLDDNNILIQLILRVAGENVKSESNNKGCLSWDDSIRVLMEKVVKMGVAIPST